MTEANIVTISQVDLILNVYEITIDTEHFNNSWLLLM